MQEHTTLTAAVVLLMLTAIVNTIAMILYARGKRELATKQEGIDLSQRALDREAHRLAQISVELDQREQRINSVMMKNKLSTNTAGVGLKTPYGDFQSPIFGRN